MVSRLKNGEKVVGLKQTKRAVQSGRAAWVFLACDADPEVVEPLAALCEEGKVPMDRSLHMRELGQTCGISVGASAAALLL